MLFFGGFFFIKATNVLKNIYFLQTFYSLQFQALNKFMIDSLIQVYLSNINSKYIGDVRNQKKVCL